MAHTYFKIIFSLESYPETYDCAVGVVDGSTLSLDDIDSIAQKMFKPAALKRGMIYNKEEIKKGDFDLLKCNKYFKTDPLPLFFKRKRA